MLYSMKKTNTGREWVVVLKRTGREVFAGTYGECQQWLEYNGHDEWN